MSRVETLKPVNRHLLIVPHLTKNETNSGVLVPEGYKPEEDKYVTATVIDVASDCTEEFRQFKYGGFKTNKILVDRTMIEEVKSRDKTHYIILQNYVVGFYRRPNEN